MKISRRAAKLRRPSGKGSACKFLAVETGFDQFTADEDSKFGLQFLWETKLQEIRAKVYERDGIREEKTAGKRETTDERTNEETRQQTGKRK